jgi:HAD superfamily hydrolase (TIGR01484 family)
VKRLIAFDLDGTLAESKQAIDPEMANLLQRLSQVAIIAVISGGDWPQFRQQLVCNLPGEFDASHMFLLPTSGTKLYRYAGDWQPVYCDQLSENARGRILAAFDSALSKAGIAEERTWGKQIEDRGSQITFSALGQTAPLEAKAAWDPGFAKRKRLQTALSAALPGFAVRIGGSTSIDITQAGVDKAYGMRKLSEFAKVAFNEMIFLGDAIYPGGNDFAVREAGIDSIAVRDVHETKRVIEALICTLPDRQDSRNGKSNEPLASCPSARAQTSHTCTQK